MEIKKHITLKHLFINNHKMIGLQFYPNRVIQALIKELPNVKWSNEFNMAYILNTKENLALIFNTFRGIVWINGNSFYKEKIIHNNAPIDINSYRERQKINTVKYVPESYLLKLEVCKYALNTCKTYISLF